GTSRPACSSREPTWLKAAAGHTFRNPTGAASRRAGRVSRGPVTTAARSCTREETARPTSDRRRRAGLQGPTRCRVAWLLPACRLPAAAGRGPRSYRGGTVVTRHRRARFDVTKAHWHRPAAGGRAAAGSRAAAAGSQSSLRWWRWSVTHAKEAAAFTSPEPWYCGHFGKSQSGRVRPG